LLSSSTPSVLELILTLPGRVHFGQSPGTLWLLAPCEHSTKLKRERREEEGKGREGRGGEEVSTFRKELSDYFFPGSQ
jgi:hypothetical protein